MKLIMLVVKPDRRRLILCLAGLGVILGVWIGVTANRPAFDRHLTLRGIPPIGIDPGHGGIDSGACVGDCSEKTVNLEFSKRLAVCLGQNGYRTVLSRDNDRLLSPFAEYQNRFQPYKRDDLERRLHKLEDAGAFLILSIHSNWSGQAYHRGPVVFFPAQSPRSSQLADAIQDELNRIQPYRKLPRPGAYYLFSHARVPIVLIELGFLSNFSDRCLLNARPYQEQLSQAIRRGLDRYVTAWMHSETREIINR